MDQGPGTKVPKSAPGFINRLDVFGLWSSVLGPARRAPRRAAFTLLELLVAAAITVMMATFIAVIVRNVSVTWTRSSNRLGSDAQARIILDQLQQDLQGALFRDDGNTWMAISVLDRGTGNSGLWDNTNANPNRIKPQGGLSRQMTATNVADARFGQAGVWLRFFTTSRGANSSLETLSAPIAVGYQIIRRPTATNTQNRDVPRGYLLHRAEVRATATTRGTARPGVLETGYNIRNAAYEGSSSSGTNSGATTGDPRSIRVPGSNTTSPRNLDSVLADNVIDFGVRCYVRDANEPGGLRVVFPTSNADGRLTNFQNARLWGQLPPSTRADETNYNDIFPEVVDVMIRILTDEGAALCANIERNQSPPLTPPLKYNSNVQEWWWGVAQENSRVYTRRIVINAKPL